MLEGDLFSLVWQANDQLECTSVHVLEITADGASVESKVLESFTVYVTLELHYFILLHSFLLPFVISLQHLHGNKKIL